MSDYIHVCDWLRAFNFTLLSVWSGLSLSLRFPNTLIVLFKDIELSLNHFFLLGKGSKKNLEFSRFSGWVGLKNPFSRKKIICFQNAF